VYALLCPQRKKSISMRAHHQHNSFLFLEEISCHFINLFSPLKEVHALCCRVKNIAAVTKKTLNFDTKVNQWSWCFPFGFENDHTKLALVKYPIDFNRCAACQSSSSTVRRLDIHILTWVVSTMCEVFYE
jgi:hypothetical protein